MENYIVSARKYRPMTFDTVVGQEALTVTLKNAIQSGRLAHAYLFCGPRGVGKTTCARIFAKTINCLNPQPNGEACGECESCKAFNEQRSYNIHELDAASNNSVEDIRQLIEQVRIPPQIGKYKVFIIDEVHMLSQAAFNAFLKTLEEPPRHAIFILATTEKHKILPTIMSRCQIYDFKRMGVDNIVSHLRHVAEQEGIKTEDAALNVIAQKADGGMRDALSIFDQVASFCEGNITYQRTIENLNVLDSDYYFRLTDYFLEGKITECMLTLNEILSKGFEGQHFIGGLSSHLRNLLVSQDAQTAGLIEASEEVRNRYREQAQRCKPKFLFRAMKLANDCDLNYKQSQNKRLLVELTLIEMAQLSSDDGEASGLCPTKILKPIFDRLRGNATSPTPAPSTTSSAPSTTPSIPPPTPSIPPPTPSIPPPTPPVRGRAPSGLEPPSPSQGEGRGKGMTMAKMRGFSIRRPTNAPVTKVETEKTEEDSVTFEDKPVDNVGLTVAWRKFAASLPHEDVALSHQLDNIEPTLQEDGSTFTVIADNPAIQQELNKRISPIEAYLRKELQNKSLHMTIRLREATDRRRVFTRVEILNQMLQQSEALRKLKEEFELELT
ncbi:MAG: DNA polymerase III subunit gamma/tau [Bacteroidaceae bacterium]|nr:DNA polymerase III subunit gamma/tau [Bacteroidaceae bacterium]